MFVQSQVTLQVDLQGFSEHCLDTTKFQVYQATKDILRTTYPGTATVQLDSSTEEAQNQYKPGGTGILILGHLASQLEPQGKGGDNLGRWSFVTFRRKNLPPLSIISIYQVCPRPTNLIGNTAYHQQVRLLNKTGRNIHPRKAFTEDLDKFIAVLMSKNHDIILGGDFNESLQDRNSGILRLATTHSLTDPFLHKFHQDSEFGTHINGRRRIDLVFVTPRILASIQAVGYAPFGFSTDSDHRPLILDFNTRVLFGQTSQELGPASNRGVKTKDLVSVQTFVTNMFEAIDRKQGFQMKASLDNDSATPQMVEYLDKVIGDSGKVAEQRCKRRRPEYYSRTLAKQRLEVSFLKCHLNALKLNRDRHAQLLQKMTRTGVVIPLPATQHLTKVALQEARLRLRETIKKNFTIRQEELEQHIQSAEVDNDRQKQQRLRAIKKAEQDKKTYQILRAMRQRTGETQHLDRVEIPASWPSPQHSVQSLDELEDPKVCQSWRLITDPEEVEYYLMLRNRLHFGQAEGTPFTQFPLQQDLDWAATSPAAEHLLHGLYTNIIDTPQCNELLTACKAQADLDSIPGEVTLAEFKGKIATWRETTTTSPSGRHLGRYKALFTKLPEIETSGDDEKYELSMATKQESIVRLILSIINYCIRNTYVLNRWKEVVNVMIFKDHGNFKIHRLRVIHIYEADFNALLAIKWRQLLHHADKNNYLHSGQHGGRPGCEAQSLTLLEELKYDLTYLTRRSLFNFDNDATSCYDRILVPLASVINRKYGLDRKIVAIHAETLQQAKFRLKTGSGISAISYSHCPTFPIHGTGQGSGNSPCIWLFISSTLFDVHESQAHGVKFVSPDGSTKVQFSMVGFVDDSTGSLNDFQPNKQQPLSQLFKSMQYDAQLWNDLLYCSGGKLELTKCSFHVLHFDFLPNGKPIPSIDRYEDTIHIQDAESRTYTPIPAKRSFETHKTLGHHKSPYSSSHLEIQDIQKKADGLALLIATSPINRQGAALAYHTVFIPSIKYTLPQSFFSRNKLEQAQSTSIKHIIAKCGYNRNTARALIFAPKSYAGGGFLPWHALQGEGQILHFLKHWRTDTVISATLRITVYWAQWQSGHHNPILEDVSVPLPYLECRWLKSLRVFLHDIKATIVLDKPALATIERANDIYIMTYARLCGLFSAKDIEIINYCRLYLHITTISELFSADGVTLIPDLFHCRREAWFDPSTYITLQRRPSDYHIRTKWQRLCRQWATADGRLAASMALGKWITSGDKLRRRRETYRTVCTPQVVYHWRYGVYWKYTPIAAHSKIFRPTIATNWTPTEPCIPISVQEHSNGIVVIPHLPNPLIPHHPLRPSRHFHDYIQSLSSWEQRLLTDVEFKHGPYEILHSITKDNSSKDVYIVSDGSQNGNNLTFGWVYGSSDGTIYAENSGSGQGAPTSHRAEAWGMLSAVLFLHHLELYTHATSQLLHHCSVIAYSDNSGLIDRIKQRLTYATPYPNTTLQPDWDLIEQIHVIRSTLLVKDITFDWVKGHQDEATIDLPTNAQFNIRADALAGSYRIPPRSCTEVILLPTEKCRLTISSTPITGHYVSAIRSAYTLPPFYDYLKHRHGWSQETFNDIDWSAYTHAARNTPISSIQLLKLVHDKLPTRYELSKSSPHLNSMCQYCANKETFHHLLCCQNPLSRTFREDLKIQLEEYFARTGISDNVQTIFLGCMPYWLSENDNTDFSAPTNHVLMPQKHIGWHLVPKGFLSTSWRDLFIQAKRSKGVTTQRGPTEFIAGIIQILWEAQMKFWDKHQTAANETTADTSPRIQALRQEYSTRIRLLHAKRDQCLHSHRIQYFHSDVESFIQSSTTTQMREYLRLYEPAIQQSIKDAGRGTLRSIFTFAGFTRNTQITLRPPLQPPGVPLSTIPSANSVILPTTAGANYPHKHTRWKTASTGLRSIKNFFFQPSPT